jgi:hypothetical protein
MMDGPSFATFRLESSNPSTMKGNHLATSEKPQIADTVAFLCQPRRAKGDKPVESEQTID